MTDGAMLAAQLAAVCIRMMRFVVCIPMTLVAPPSAANIDRMPVPHPTSNTLAPFIKAGFCLRASL